MPANEKDMHENEREGPPYALRVWGEKLISAKQCKCLNGAFTVIRINGERDDESI